MTGLVSILTQQLTEAQAQGDLPRQVALAVALLKERVSDSGRILSLITDACATLAAENDPGDLTAVLGWYQTWHRHTRAPEAKAGMEAVQERITRVEDAQRVLRDAITARDAATLRTALAGFAENADRLAETPTLLNEGQTLLDDLVSAARRSWSERISRSRAVRERLIAAMPSQLDVAMAAYQELLALDPTVSDDPALTDLVQRAEQARNRQRLLEDALKMRALQPLEAAGEAVASSLDRLSDTQMLLDRALVARSERRARLEQLHGELAAIDRKRLDLLVPVLEELAELDPVGPAAASLATDRQRMVMLAAWQQTIVGAEDAELDELTTAVESLAASSERLAESATLITRGRAVVRRRAGVIATRKRLQGIGIAAGGVLVLTMIGLVIRDQRGFAAIAAAPDPAAALAAAQQYHAGWHLFHQAAADKEIVRLQDEVMASRLAALAAMPDPGVRMQGIDAMLAGPVSSRREALIALRDHTRLELEDRAFATANGIADPTARIAALSTYAAGVGDASRAQTARDTIVVVERERDAAMWAAVLAAKEPSVRLAAVAAYLALPAPVKTKDAERLRDQARADQQRSEQRAADEAAWTRAAAVEEPVAGLAAIDAYLAGPNPGHGLDARERSKRLLVKRDEAAWATANADGAAQERLTRLRAYLIGPVPRAHDSDAQQGIAAAVWAIASAPTEPAARLASVRAYLADAANTAFRTEAEALADELPHTLDLAAWDRARSPAEPAARIAAIQAYLASPGEHDHLQDAYEEIARAARPLIDSDPKQVTALPRAMLERIPVAELLRLPEEHFNRLPPTLRARLPAPLAWASSTGVDDYGRWAVLTVGPHQVRLRYITEGQVQVPTPNGMVVVANSTPFWLAETECTQALWSEPLRGFFSDGNPSKHRGPDLPVHRVSRDDCQRFIAACNALLIKEGGRAQVRLPTGAEWAFVAFTGTDGLAAIDRGTARGYDVRDLVRLAYAQENGRAPGAVGGGRRDRWGVTDLLGNVSEWCADDLDGSPHWRGGAWVDSRADCRPERSQKAKSSEELEWVGLRLVVVAGAAASAGNQPGAKPAP
ncbi:MAG TPA: SUMF1/EgtB/PvdO family nonheme iron enzyme [Planctomycetota bacterium]|nr:SUMF1/EgtB/PvdO family nonheme iron enzyme [Planctomycetota bacterium]